MTPDRLQSLSRAIAEEDDDRIAERMQAALAAGCSAADLRAALLAGLERVRSALRSERMPVAEFLLCLDRTTRGLARVPEPPDPTGAARPTVVLGVVAGDPHDLGKEIVAAVYRAHGFAVIDLGRDVSQRAFVEAVDHHDADLLGLSAMMSTTMAAMKQIIPAVRARRPATAVVVGGAPLSPALARVYGADGYAESALDVIEVTREVLARRARTTTV